MKGSRYIPLLIWLLAFAGRAGARAPHPDPIRDAVVEWTRALVRIPSVTGDEHEVAAFLEERARARGLVVERLDTPEGRPNLLISRRPVTGVGPHIVFLGHLDVVPVAGQRWTHPPFSGALIDGEIWGRGSIDNKGSLAVALVTLEETLRRHGRDAGPNISVLAVSGVELDGIGARYVASHHLDRIAPTVILGEGGLGVRGVVPGHDDVTFFGIASAEKSSYWLKVLLNVEGSGHGSVPSGDTSVQALVRALNRLERDPFDVTFTEDVRAMLRSLARLERWPRNLFMRNPDLPLVRRVVRRFLSSNPLTHAMIRNTATITEVGSDPGPPNVIPANAWATLDCRLLPGTREEDFLQELVERLAEPRARIEVIEVKPNVRGSSSSPFMSVISDTLERDFPGAVAAPIVFPATSDNNEFRIRNIPAFGVLPMVLGEANLRSIHAADERVPIVGFGSAVESYLNLIDAVARQVRDLPERVRVVTPDRILEHPRGHHPEGPCSMGFLGGFMR